MRTPTEPERAALLTLFQAALERVNGRNAVRDFLQHHPDRDAYARGRIAAVGKAAAAMALGALEVLGEKAGPVLVITRHGHGHPRLPSSVRLMEAGHPVPDGASLAAGQALLEFVAEQPEQPLLFLLSGGASALVEVLPDGIGLDALQGLNDWLLGAGLDIRAMNRVRKGLSCIKQGRLARALHGRPTLQLLIADVPGEDPAVIGSGPLVPDPDAGTPLPDGLPGELRALLERAPAPPPFGDPCFRTIETHVIAGNRQACEAAAAAGRARGWAVFLHPEPLAGEAAEQGRRLATQLLAGPPGLHVWGGETVVRLPEHPGRGGRCQHLALAAAEVLSGRDDLLLLAAGTDGSDGPGEDAGALVDGGSVQRGEEAGFDLRWTLERADAGRFLEASGDLIHTGPTGTNVMDLVLAFKRP